MTPQHERNVMLMSFVDVVFDKICCGSFELKTTSNVKDSSPPWGYVVTTHSHHSQHIHKQASTTSQTTNSIHSIIASCIIVHLSRVHLWIHPRVFFQWMDGWMEHIFLHEHELESNKHQFFKVFIIINYSLSTLAKYSFPSATETLKHREILRSFETEFLH